MSTTEVRQRSRFPGGRWWVPVVLALIILGVILGSYLATHPHAFGGGATATPTPTPRVKKVVVTPTFTPTPLPTSTPKPGPTGTPRPGPTGTPKPGPTATPKPGPTATPTGPQVGAVTYPAGQVQALQKAANAGTPGAQYALNPFNVVKHDLPRLGFSSVNIVSPTPQPSPTPFTNANGLPTVKITVQYQGKTYVVTLVQPLQQGPKGIWIISKIAAA